jgi:hypothetical protein
LHALLKVDNLVVPFSFPYLAPIKAQPGFIPREITSRAVDIGRRPAQTSAPATQDIRPHESESSNSIAAGQEPYFE